MASEKGRDLRRAIDDYVGSGGHPGLVLEALESALHETASHLETNWQDRAAARVWEKLARWTSSLADKVDRELARYGYK